jgi:hypothetical protein
MPVPAHKINWFEAQAPDRPVENGTVFVIPENETETD